MLSSVIVLSAVLLVISAYQTLTRPEAAYLPRWAHLSAGRIAVFIIACATIARICRYVRGEPFDYDESLLRMATYGWSPDAPLRPLQFEQAAAPLFIALSRGITALWRIDEYGWRLLPLFFSIVLLPVLYYAVSGLWSRGTAVVALGLACVHLELLRYSAIFKQYELDAAITAGAFAFAAYYRRNDFQRRTWILLIAFGVFAELLSQAAIIPLATSLGFILITEMRLSGVANDRSRSGAQRRTVLRWTSLAALVWIGVTTPMYLLTYSSVAHSKYMGAFWSDSYPTWHGDVLARWTNAGISLFNALPGPMTAGLLLFTIGLCFILRKHDIPVLLLTVGPVTGTVLLACLHRYPVAPRLWLFLTPAIIMTVSIGVTSIWGILRHLTSERAATLIAFALLLPFSRRPAPEQFAVVLDPVESLDRFHDGPPAAAARHAAARVLDSCDNVYVAARGIPSWFFYSSQLDGQTGRRFAKFEKLFRFGAPAFGDARPESLNFPNPGGDLHLRSGCRSEIYGFASGTPNWSRSEQMRDVPRVPKEGWAENEIHRMTAGRSSPFWLYLGEAGWFEIQPIVDGLTRAGWKLIPVGIEPTPAVLFPYHGLTIYRVEKPCRTHRAERTTPGDHAAF